MSSTKQLCLFCARLCLTMSSFVCELDGETVGCTCLSWVNLNCRAMKSKNSSFPRTSCLTGAWCGETHTQHRYCLEIYPWSPKPSGNTTLQQFTRISGHRTHQQGSLGQLHTTRHCFCSKKTLKLKQSVPPPKTPDPVDGRRHIKLQVGLLRHETAFNHTTPYSL